MAVRFEWTDDFSVGDQELDTQHRYLFAIGNRLQDAGVEGAQKIAMELFQYCREHFEAEEAQMQKVGYPDLDLHHEFHNNLINDLNVTVDGGIKDQDQLEAFIVFFRRWLIEHVMYQDKKYFDFCQTQAE